MTYEIPAIFFILLMSVVFAVEYSYLSQKRTWNGGICKETGEPWFLRGRDANGRRYYTTASGMNCDFTWGVDTLK
jgi:hypothetical protein